MFILKLLRMKRVASPGSMHDTGCLGLVHWDDQYTFNYLGNRERLKAGGEGDDRG